MIKKAALRFLNKAINAINRNGKVGLINIDKSGANTAGIKPFNKDNKKRIKIRQCQYLNNIVEQDHRFIKKLVRATLGFKSFHLAQKTIKGFELIHLLNIRSDKKEFVWRVIRCRSILCTSCLDRQANRWVLLMRLEFATKSRVN